VISYWEEGCKFLLNKDPTFKKYYNSNHSLKLNKNKFDVLFKSICSQQISVSAAMSIYNNSKKIIGPINYINFKKNILKLQNYP
jgi:3-methyladenine DNA glycosylase/8-oxoguanine DNA glycosylase